MKYIQKGEEPSSFTTWKALATEDWIPTYTDLRGQEKADLQNSLLADQGYICCYCGIQINQENSHIEHLPSQSSFVDLADAINYQHLLASCGISEQWRKNKYQKEWAKEEFENLLSCTDRCGIKRGDRPLPISPLQFNCEAFFRYDASNGAIRAKEDFDHLEAAPTTIAILNLNTQKLRDLRKTAIDTAILLIEELTEEEIVRLFKGKNQRGELIPFCFAIANVLKI